MKEEKVAELDKLKQEKMAEIEKLQQVEQELSARGSAASSPLPVEKGPGRRKTK